MFSKPDFTRHGPLGALLAAAVLFTAMLSACAGSTANPADSSAAQAAVKTAPQVVATALPGQAAAPASTTALPATDEVVRMLAYADRLRLMPPPELSQEVSRLGTPLTSLNQLQLALALSQLRQLPELIRAQELLTRVIGNTEAQALHPLARLLAARYGEQRRLEEQLDKQNQQLRDVQRRLDQTNERLEALKAIERSLTSRPAASSPAPAGRARPTAP